MPQRRTIRTLPLIAVLLATSGCAYFEDWNVPLFTQSGEQIPAKDGDGERPTRTYPKDAEQGEALDIEVVRTDKAIRLINRTTRSYDEAELWLNHGYGAPIDEIPVGKTEPISLTSFYNEHGERYPLGMFLAPDLDEALVEADLIVDGTIHPLPVRLEEDWDEPSSRP